MFCLCRVCLRFDLTDNLIISFILRLLAGIHCANTRRIAVVWVLYGAQWLSSDLFIRGQAMVWILEATFEQKFERQKGEGDVWVRCVREGSISYAFIHSVQACSCQKMVRLSWSYHGCGFLSSYLFRLPCCAIWHVATISVCRALISWRPSPMQQGPSPHLTNTTEAAIALSTTVSSAPVVLRRASKACTSPVPDSSKAGCQSGHEWM